MAFTFDSTPSGLSANSYASLEQADDYFSSRFRGDSWFEFTDVQKQQLLVSSTRDIDTALFSGYKTIRTQPLEWPRTGLYDREGNAITGIPTKLIEAVCELAVWKYSEEDRMLSDIDLQQVESFKAGPLDIKVKASAMVFPIKVEQLLKSIGPQILASAADGKSGEKVRFSR